MANLGGEAAASAELQSEPEHGVSVCLCPVCKAACESDGEESIECSKCLQWHHWRYFQKARLTIQPPNLSIIRCENVTRFDNAVINDTDWFCSLCQPKKFRDGVNKVLKPVKARMGKGGDNFAECLSDDNEDVSVGSRMVSELLTTQSKPKSESRRPKSTGERTKLKGAKKKASTKKLRPFMDETSDDDFEPVVSMKPAGVSRKSADKNVLGKSVYSVEANTFKQRGRQYTSTDESNMLAYLIDHKGQPVTGGENCPWQVY